MIFNFYFFDRIFSWVEYENVIKIKRGENLTKRRKVIGRERK